MTSPALAPFGTQQRCPSAPDRAPRDRVCAPRRLRPWAARSLFGAAALTLCGTLAAEVGAKPKQAKTESKQAASTPEEEAARKAAKEAYAAGQTAYGAGDFKTAAARFDEADSILPSPHAKYWAAMSLARVEGSGGEAQARLEAFLALPDASRLGEDKLQAARAQLEALNQAPAQVTLKVAPATAQVKVDGRAVDAKSRLSLPAGKHDITVSAPNHEGQTLSLTLHSGETTEKTVTLTAIASATPGAGSKADTGSADGSGSHLPAYITLGVAGGAAIVGTIFGVQALSAKSDFDKHPTTAAADDTERNALIADMAWGLALTLGVTGTVLLLTGDSGGGSTPSAGVSRARTALRLTPYVSPTAAGAAARLTF